MIKRIVLYPFLLALYPVLTILANNVDQVDATAAVRPLLGVMILTIIIYLVFLVSFKDWHRAGLASSLILILFFSYGHVYSLIEDQSIGGLIFGRHRYLILIAGGIIVIGLLIIWKKIKFPEKTTPFLNLVTGVMLLFPIFTLVSFNLEDSPELSPVDALEEKSTTSIQDGTLPDIYYIILDSYAREDVLEAIYQYDNTEFIEGLTEIGFYFPDNSRSNYSQTSLSLSSSLNMDYVEDFIGAIDEDNLDKAPLNKALANSRVRELLESLGYKFIAIDSTVSETQIKNADIFLSANNEETENLGTTQNNLSVITPFEMIFIESTGGVLLTNMASKCVTLQNQEIDSENIKERKQSLECRLAGWLISQKEYPYENLRNNILYTFDTLPNLPDVDAPRFVFVHMLAPHFPFIFGPNGEISHQTDAFSLTERGGFAGNRQTYIEGYTDELIYTNKKITETVREIITNSERPPIIIIQADHGSHANMIPGEPDPLSIPYHEERFAILNTYYLPNCDTDQLYEGITPVNTFRVVFNACFGLDYDILEDYSYYSDYSSPYKFIDVTSEISE